MEIRHDRIYDVPLIAGINIELCPAAAGFHLPALPCRFQSAHGRRADGNDPAAFRSGLIDLLRRLFRHGIPFPVHFMIFNIFFRDRTECADPHVERHEKELRSAGFHFFQQLRRKVQSRRRRRCRSLVFRVNRLILALVFQLS